MSNFTSPDPLGRYLENGVDFQLYEPLEFFYSKQEGVGESIIVEKEFITDFASIPAFIQPIIPQCKGRRAAIIHDKLYKTKGLNGKFTRKQCDQIFYNALTVLKVEYRIKVALYLGVRIGGWIPWHFGKDSVYGK
jgi:Protein of unknown function (DUF1353)